MTEVKIPEFLKYNSDMQKNRLSVLINQYEERFGKTWSTEPFDITDEELEKVFERCLKENKIFYDVIGFEPNNMDEDEEW